MLVLLASIFFSHLFTLSIAKFSFSHGDPTQCDDLSLSWTGGTAPFYVTLTPIFGTPRNISIPNSSFSNGKGSYSTQLVFPKDQKFLISMSDSTGFGSGGNTDLLTVGASKGGSCNTTDPGVAFSYELNTALQQCREFTFANYAAAVQPVTIVGIVPSGTSFVLHPPPGQTFFDWTANVWNGTSLIFLMVDARGSQGGASDVRTVGFSDDRTCITGDSPSSTAVPTATSTGAPSTSSSSSSSSPSTNDDDESQSSTPIGAVAGTVLGALLFLATAIAFTLFYLKRRKEKRYLAWDSNAGGTDFTRHSQRLRSDVDLHPVNHAVNYGHMHGGNNYAPAPSHTPSTTANQSWSNLSNPFNAPYEMSSHPPTRHQSTIDPFTETSPASSSVMSASQRKAAMARTESKPARYILHTDAEDVPSTHKEEEEEEVVELPPQYTERAQLPQSQSNQS